MPGTRQGSLSDVAFGQLLSGHAQLIAQNPIDLVMHRYVRERAGVAFAPWHEDPEGGLGPFRVRVHQQGRGSAQVAALLTGSQERDPTWGILMGPEPPLRVTDGQDGDVRVEIEHPVHGRFRLRRLRALEASGKLWGWQGDLERIAGRGPVPEQLNPAPGRPALQDDPAWVSMMRELDDWLGAHPGQSAEQGLRELEYEVPPERTLGGWRQRWRALRVTR